MTNSQAIESWISTYDAIKLFLRRTNTPSRTVCIAKLAESLLQWFNLLDFLTYNCPELPVIAIQSLNLGYQLLSFRLQEKQGKSTVR